MNRLALSCLVLLAACGGTERTRRTFPVEVSASSAPLLTDSGWAVTLTKANAHLASVRFFAGKVLLAQRSPWWRGLLIADAYAHPGHYIPGEALGELVQAADVDLLATTPTSWGTASAVTGEYGSMQLTFATGGLELEGVATKDTQRVEFTATFTPSGTLEGIRFERVMNTAAGFVTVLLDLNVVLSRIDFAQVGTRAKPLDSTSPAFNGLGRGVEDTGAYVTTWKDQ